MLLGPFLVYCVAFMLREESAVSGGSELYRLAC